MRHRASLIRPRASASIRVHLRLILAFLSLSAFAADSALPETDLARKLKALPGVKALAESRKDPAYQECYTLTFEQPLDHQKPDGEKFTQRVHVSHVNFDAPVLLETEGYSSNGNRKAELQKMLGGSMVTVEHRFFGKSVPVQMQWEYLTVKQSADDLHAVVSALKTLYTGKWVSTGTSKGGQTSLFYKCYYPDDMTATVAYVAPINVTQEDPRINQFLDVVGDAETRKKVRDYQLAMLDREEEILPLIKTMMQKKKRTFAQGLPEAYEHAVLEYPYAFWQEGGKPNEIPASDAPAEKLAAHFDKLDNLHYICDAGKKYFEPYFYQAFTETGYYNYDLTPFKSHLKCATCPSNLTLCPDGVKIVYNPATMAFVHHFLQYDANRVIYIYGELDAWSATQMQLIGRTDAFKIVVAKTPHGARIRGFSPEQKEIFFSNMERWLGTALKRE